MKLTNHEEYGLRCLLRLAEQGEDGTLTIPELGRAEGVSEPYVAKLLRILRLAGFVKAARGKVGGYALSRPAGEILIGDVMRALGSPFFEARFCDSHAGRLETCVRLPNCSLRGLWRTIQTSVDQVLNRTTLADLLAGEENTQPWTHNLEILGALPASPSEE